MIGRTEAFHGGLRASMASFQMPLFLCRWPNGDCSIVLARNETDAVERLDEVGNAEGCPITRLSTMQVHFTLTDEARLVLDGLGEDAEAQIFEFCYPEIVRALTEGEDVAVAARRERERVRVAGGSADEPATQVGRCAKARLDMPTTLVDRLFSRAAKQRIKSFKPRGDPN